MSEKETKEVKAVTKQKRDAQHLLSQKEKFNIFAGYFKAIDTIVLDFKEEGIKNSAKKVDEEGKDLEGEALVLAVKTTEEAVRAMKKAEYQKTRRVIDNIISTKSEEVHLPYGEDLKVVFADVEAKRFTVELEKLHKRISNDFSTGGKALGEDEMNSMKTLF